MKILLCAFACSPQWGSEPGVGWRWAHELAREHEVVVLTHLRFKDHIDASPQPLPSGLRFEYYSAPWPAGWNDQLLNWVPYYAWWLLSSTRRARALQAEHRFDLVHHITLGTFRYPSLYGFLGPPFAIGPVGGGERSPFALRRSMPRRDRLKDLLRDLLIFSARFDPSLWLTFSRACVIVCKTNDTLAALPRWAQSKAVQSLEIGATPSAPRQENEPREGPLRLLYVGRLIGLKGVHLLLRSVQRLQAAGVEVELAIIGKGPQRDALQRQAAESGIASLVRFIDFMPQERLHQHYCDADLFVFPSLHDSSGGVVYEALSCGLPVVCLDLGGPKHAVTPECARVIPTHLQSETQIVEALARTIEQLARDPLARRTMAEAALQHAARRTWQQAVADVYSEIERRLSTPRGPA